MLWMPVVTRAVHRYCAHGAFTAVVQQLLHASAAVDAADIDGDNLLHMASYRCHATVVILLLAASTDRFLQVVPLLLLP